MPFELPLSKRLKSEKWKVKIRDQERVEDPHLTLLRNNDLVWRIGLRSLDFLVPPGGSWKEIDRGVEKAIRDNWTMLQAEWDRMYPENPISSVEPGRIGDGEGTDS